MNNSLRDTGVVVWFVFMLPVFIPIYVVSFAVLWLGRQAIEAVKRLRLVATGDENDYYAWADQRLDELAEQARKEKTK